MSEEKSFLLHCTETKIHQDLYNRLPVLLRIQLFNTKLLEPPKQELGEYSGTGFSETSAEVETQKVEDLSSTEEPVDFPIDASLSDTSAEESDEDNSAVV